MALLASFEARDLLCDGSRACGSSAREICVLSAVVHIGAVWCKLWIMSKIDKSVRQSVSLPACIAKHVRVIAKTRKTSANRVLVDLIEAGLQSKQAEKEQFFALANRLTESVDPAERQRLKEELARMTFGQ